MLDRRFLMLLVFSLIIWIGCGSSPEPESVEEAPPRAEETAKVEEPPAEPEPAPEPKAEPKAGPKAVQKKAPAPAKKAEAQGPPVVAMQTSKGTIRIELYPERAPNTVENFLRYVDERFYDGTIFHRVMPDFMIQGGGFTSDMTEKTTHEPIQNEAKTAGLANLRGTIAMARTQNPHSATAQFFINHGRNNQFLNPDQAPGGWGYAVFGKVVEGMDVVDAIAGVPTANKGMHQNVPVDPVVIQSVRRVN